MPYKTRKAPPKGRQSRRPKKRELLPEYLAACELVGIRPPTSAAPGHLTQGDLAEHRLAVWAAWQACRKRGMASADFARKIGSYKQKVWRWIDGLALEADVTDEPDAHNLVWAVFERLDGARSGPLPQSVVTRAMAQVGVVK